MNYIKGKERDQLRIESIESYIDEDNEVRVIDKIIDYIDIESLGFTIGKNSVAGRASYNPRDLLKLYVYGYLNGIRSSRKLAKQCLINKEVIWLVKDTTPKYRVIADFRKDNVVALEHLFNHFVQYCIGLGLYGKTLIAVDGTKLEASASKRKHYSKNKITKMRSIAEAKIREYLHDIEIADKSEDVDSETIDRAKVQKSIAKLEENLKHYDDIETQMDIAGHNEINFTDNDARTVKFGAHQGTDVGYNVQSAVDSKNKLIAAFSVVNISTDHGQLFNMTNKCKEIYNVETLSALADKGYFQISDLVKCENNGIITYVAKPNYSTQIGDSRYFNNKFKYKKQDNLYIYPEGQKLYCITIKEDTKTKTYNNFEACANCKNKSKCNNAKNGKVMSRDAFSDLSDTIIRNYIDRGNVWWNIHLEL
ncbi:transposase [Clostridium gasigenes]|uniref:transposase n=1 Tax=Clostridium gasigenes TaxID=94869 RepID=UPI001C0BCF0C|nr:transposase [Clostridium gasigenes]MBU3106204.1 transposase [Clostridium gasigenes]